MESSAASGVICLQFPPQPKVNRLWDLLEKVSPVCRAYWIAMGWGAWRDDEHVQADQVPVIPPINRTASRSAIQTAGLKPPHPCITLLGGARFRLKHQPSLRPLKPGSVRQLHCFSLNWLGGSTAHSAVYLITVCSKHMAACAEHNRPLPHRNKTPKPANVSNSCCFKPHKLPVRSYSSNIKAEAASCHLLSGKVGSWEVCDQLGLDLSYPSNAAPAHPAALGATMERRVSQRTSSFGRQIAAPHSLR